MVEQKQSFQQFQLHPVGRLQLMRSRWFKHRKITTIWTLKDVPSYFDENRKMYEDALHLIRIFPKLLFVGVLTILELLKDNLAHLSHSGLEVSGEDLRRMNITLRNKTINVKDKSKVVLANLEDQI